MSTHKDAMKRVHVYRTSPRSLEADVGRALDAERRLDPEKALYIKVNANYDRDWPGCNTSRWFLDALLRSLRARGFKAITAIEGDLKLQPAVRTVEKIGLKRVMDAYGVPFLPIEGLPRDDHELPELLHGSQLINTSVLHTHTFAVISCATKNMYGLLPMYREKYHAVLSQKLIGVKEHLESVDCRMYSIIDGTVGLEGGSMRMGSPKRADLLISGTDTLALDFVAARAMGFAPGDIPLLRRAVEYRAIDPASIVMDGDLSPGFPEYHFAYKSSGISAVDLWLRRNSLTGKLFTYDSPMDRLAQRVRRAYTTVMNNRNENAVMHGEWEEYRTCYDAAHP